MRFLWLILAASAAVGGLALAQDEAQPSAGPAETSPADAVAAEEPRAWISAEPGDPRISGLRVAVEEQQVRLSFRLVDAFGEALKKRIDSGLYSGYLFEFELTRARKSWFSKIVDSSRLQVVAVYNVVTREYLINLRHDGDLIDSRVVQDVDQLEDALTHFEDLNVFSVAGIDPDQRLRVRVRAQLGTRTVFFFIPRTIQTNWAESGTFRLVDLQ